MLPLTMPRPPKKPPWNAGLKIPGYGDTPKHVVKPSSDQVLVGHSTPGPVEEWRIIDDAGTPYMVGGHEWRGNSVRAATEAQRLSRETGRAWTASKVVG